jgi:uncharacterized protein (TIGR00266 family)
MEVETLYKPTYSLGVIKLAGGEQVRVEGGSMVSMSAGIQVETKATGGFLKSLARKALTSESFFQNVFTAPPEGGHVAVAPTLPGDITVREVQGDAWLVQGGDYVASEMGVEVDSKWGGAKTFFGGEGLFMLRCFGRGKLVLSSYGAIHEFDLAAGQRYTIDTGHLVAFPEGMQFNIKTIGGLKSTLFSGEGIVVELVGPGKVLMQTRSWNAFMSYLVPQLPSNTGS